ncbi:hypothetical protein BJI69_13885 [Luteibacter rhizovicinus DSM 16549]|uniref:Toxin co-regulated pilus biosynthesis protein Q C-terminal domain-containing protein n=2 Tax=Luteibacter rhizovicinus TaxID=242606 RepID=A0A1L3EUY0_9GAMM|nr:hypothetical protein BJI69_13885 [Luteibacter rhizovicinus DSM 16549]
MLLSACGTPAAKDFGGSWKPVNKYDDKVVEIPLALPYTYYAAPMDSTLKTMLTRWTKDTGLKLQYRLRSDFSLTRAASGIHTTELRDATAQLSKIYGAQGVAVTVNGSDLVVEEVSASVAPAPVAPPASAAVVAPSAPVTASVPEPTPAAAPANDGHVVANADAK